MRVILRKLSAKLQNVSRLTPEVVLHGNLLHLHDSLLQLLIKFYFQDISFTCTLHLDAHDISTSKDFPLAVRWVHTASVFALPVEEDTDLRAECIYRT